MALRGALAGLFGGLALAPGPAFKAPLANQAIDLVLGANVVSKTGNEYICATTDWWPPMKCDYGVCGWTNTSYGGNPSIPNLDVEQPLFREAFKELSPFIWRLGGSLQDYITYEEPGTGLDCPPITVDANVKFGFTGGCLTQARWKQLATLAKDNNNKLVFGLNELVGRTHVVDKTWSGEWNSSNTRALLQFTKENDLPIYGWELGNELGGWNGIAAQLPADAVGKDFLTLKDLITEIWGEEGKDNRAPMVIGPDTSLDIPWYTTFLNTVKGNINAVNIHLYALGAGVDPALKTKIMDPAGEHIKEATDEALNLLKLTREIAGDDVQLWMGEDGGAYNSGQNGTTNRFTAGFWSLNELGTFARGGFSVYCRQTLLGGNYGLLDKDTLQPNPDFFNYLLFKRLMGPDVLDVAPSGNTNIRAFAHCTRQGVAEKGAVTLLVINYSQEDPIQINSFKVAESNKDLLADSRLDFQLTSPDVINGTTSYLNGQPLTLSAKGKYPTLDPAKIQEASPLILPPASYGFFVFPKANLQTCSSSSS